MQKQPNIKRIFITGGAGFIGANLTKYLIDNLKCNVTVYDNLTTGSKANLDRAVANSAKNGAVEFIEGDILDFDTLNKAVAKHDTVVHLAAHTRVRESIKNPKENQTVNSIGTFNTIEAARKQRVDKFVFASSNAAVGEQKPPINEKMIPKPLSPYGAVKLYGEAICSAYYHSYGLKTVSLRFANAYGPYSDHKTSVIAKFLKRIRDGKKLEIYGDGKQTRDFIHAHDICQAIYLIITHDNSSPSPWGQVFQIATGKETAIIKLAQMLISFTDSPKNLITFAPPIKGEIRKNFSDITKAKEIFGFSPKMNLNTELKALCEETG
ncbi:MAG: NAD-dependent epimerase/dehydratase family protein [Planctomycetota bacterium]|nr:MAG: NAD-dependent epimerase/dehydratase family protein [Planctomycetota bacterium]